MRVIQIHAGIHKTGSTAIQLGLARLAPDLAAHGIALPNFGARGRGHHVLAAFASDPDACARAWAEAAGCAEEIGADRILISSEHLVGADPAALKSALAAFGPHVPRLQVYVRPHVALFTSLYLQRVKAGAARTAPTDLADRYMRSPEFDYVPTLERFIKVFGPDAVAVREFDPDRFEGGSLLADAWQFLDLPPALLPAATAGGDETVNPTPTAEQAALLMALARHLHDATPQKTDPLPLRSALRVLLDELRARLPGPGTRYRLPLPLQAEIRARMQPARAEFARHLDRPASAGFRDEPLLPPEPAAPVPMAAVEAALAATARLLRSRGWTDRAEATEDFAACLRPEPGPDGAPCVALTAHPYPLAEAMT